MRGRTLTVANIGDSRVILGRRDPRDGKLKAVSVSEDHKPDREDEMKRIVSRGGRVFAVEYEDGIDGPPRVWLGHMDIPGLAMSRSLGDTVAHTAGVISEPEMHVATLVPEDKIMIWASDGLWEFMSNQEVGACGGLCVFGVPVMLASYILPSPTARRDDLMAHAHIVVCAMIDPCIGLPAHSRLLSVPTLPPRVFTRPCSHLSLLHRPRIASSSLIAAGDRHDLELRRPAQGRGRARRRGQRALDEGGAGHRRHHRHRRLLGGAQINSASAQRGRIVGRSHVCRR